MKSRVEKKKARAPEPLFGTYGEILEKYAVPSAPPAVNEET